MILKYMVLWGVYGVFMVYFITFVYSLSAPWQVYLDKKFLDSWAFLWVFMGFPIFYRILKANGTWFMNIWSYGVSMGFLWCILKLLCIASLHHDKCVSTQQIFRYMGFLMVFLQLLCIPSLYCAASDQRPRVVSNHPHMFLKNGKTITSWTSHKATSSYITLSRHSYGTVHPNFCFQSLCT